MRTTSLVLLALVDLSLATPPGGGDSPPSPGDRPFILWTKAEAATLRKTMQTQPWAQTSLHAMRQVRREGNGAPILDLFAYQVLGDEAAGKAQRDYLLSFVNAKVDSRRWSDHYLTALRYDVLHDSLTAGQREALENTFRAHVQHELDNPYVNDRLSLLPNMQLPRMFSAHMLALSLRDEKLIRRIWAAPSGFRWFFGEYLADGGLYNEEFAKMYSLVGEMLLLCRGLDRLGLGELGYDFKGRDGATMRSYVESLIWLGWPRTDIPGGMPVYGRVSMGDTRGGGLFQHANICGFRRDGNAIAERGTRPFYASNMNGRDHRDAKVDKLAPQQWFEILAAKYPDSCFPYFLAQMRRPGQNRYCPSPLWGLSPIDPNAVQPPPAPSRVFAQRGFAVLRHDESPAYWQSSDPAVAMQFATLYVHYTSDCFSLLGYHAFRRPIYVNRSISAGYNGGPWDFHVRGHCGVVVDGLQAQPIGEVPTRQHLSPPAKFLWARGTMLHPDHPYRGRGEVRSSDQTKTPATEIYPGVDLARALVLTREYLFDVYQLRSGRPRQYHWLVHAPGRQLIPNDDGAGGWRSSDDLNKTLLNLPEVKVTNQRRRDCGDRPFDVMTLQTCRLDDPDKSLLGREWYDRRIGVRVHVLGEEGTAAYTFDTPVCYTPGSPRAPKDPNEVRQPESGGVSVAVERRKPATTFVALHEPFERLRPPVAEFRRVAQSVEGVAVAVTGAGTPDGSAGTGGAAPALAAGPPVNDRVMVRMAGDANSAVTLASASAGDATAGAGESFTFRTYAFIRITPAAVDCRGDLAACRIRVPGAPTFVLNGKPADAKLSSGWLTFPSR
jgi:hypothetical protein